MWSVVALLPVFLHPPEHALSLTEALDRAANQPRALARAESAEAWETAADAVLPLPAVLLEALPGARLTPAGVANAAVQGTLAVPLPLADPAGARRALARAAAASARSEAGLLLFEAEAAVIGAWFDRRAAEARLVQADEALVAARSDAAAVQTAVTAGAADAADVAEHRAFVAEMVLFHLDAEGACFDAGLRLGRAVGIASEVGTSGPLPATLASRLPPHELAAQAAVASAEAAAVMAKNATVPVIDVGVSAQIDDPDTSFAFARLGLTLPALDGDPVGRTAARAARTNAQADAEQARRTREVLVRGLMHELVHTEEVLDITAHELVPAARDRLRLAEQRRALGDGSIREVLRARRGVIEAVARWHDAENDHERARLLARHASVAVDHPATEADDSPGHAAHPQEQQ
jgi:outer membrane protein TolC